MSKLGELITAEMTAKDWNQSDLAAVTGKSKQYISDILNGKRALDAEGAVLIGAALEVSAEELLLIGIREAIARETERLDVGAIERRSAIESRFNLRLLQEDGYFGGNLDYEQMEKALAPARKIVEATHRRGSGEVVTPKQASWLAAVQLQVKSCASKFPAYQEDGLRELAASIPRQSADVKWLKKLPQLAAKVGLILVSKKVFPGAALHGASFRIPVGDRMVPVIALTAKGGRADSVIFTLLHEIGHHLLGHIEGSLCLNYTNPEDDCEAKANDFAADIIGANQILDYPSRPSRELIADTAYSLNIPEWFVIGHLQKLGVVPWASPLSRVIPNIQEEVLSWQPAYAC